MIAELAVHRQPIVDALRALDRDLGEELAGVNHWGEDLRVRMLEFAQRGKLIRGSLVAASAAAFGRPADRAVYTVAAAVELVQSFLLIHDDVMDEDPVRRGVPAVFEQYREFGSEHGFRHGQRFGESMAICAGDVAILVVFAAIGSVDIEEAARARLVSLIAREIAKVGVAQMADVANGHNPAPATEEEIISVYRFKTGRYTFSLPLMLGAILAGTDATVVDALCRWGDLQGVVFQIRDDQLGIMGDTEQTGKPVGSDIMANKQTLHRLMLFEAIAGTAWEDVRACFGRDRLSIEEVRRVRRAFEETGTIGLLDRRIARLRSDAARELSGIELGDAPRLLLDAIDAYNAAREV